MKPTEILEQIDPEADWVEFRRKEVGAGCWVIRIIPQYGNDFIMPEPYSDFKAVNQAVKDLTLAYRLGKKMAARQIMKQVEKKI